MIFNLPPLKYNVLTVEARFEPVGPSHPPDSQFGTHN